MLFRDGARLGARTFIALGVLAFRTTALVLSEDGLALVTLVEGVLLSEGIAWVAVWVLLLLGSILLLVGCKIDGDGRDLRIARAIGAADVTAVGALLVSVREKGVALVAVTTHTLSWFLKHEILSSIASWLGNQWLARLSLARGSSSSSSGSGGGSSSSGSGGLLNPLRWRAGAVLATLVRALWADLLAPEFGLALVAGAVDTETDLLLDTFGSLAEVDGIDGGRVNAGLSGDLELVLIVLGLVLWCWSGLGGGGSLGGTGRSVNRKS